MRSPQPYPWAHTFAPQGEFIKKITRRQALDYQLDPVDSAAGVFRRDNVRTQHFKMKDIKEKWESKYGSVKGAEKVEYPWSTELPNLRLGPPYPFDWLLICERS